MVTLSKVARSINRQFVGKPKPSSSSAAFLSQIRGGRPDSAPWQYQSLRSLLLESVSDCVKLRTLSDADSGIVEVTLDRPGVKNAIGWDMLRGLQQSFESINRNPSANVLMICSSVPRVFCAGADLKERKAMNSSEVQDFVNSLRSTFSYLEGWWDPTTSQIGWKIGGEGTNIYWSESLWQRCSFNGCIDVGLVNHCVPAGEALSKALEIARNINQKGPLALRMAKRAINEGLNVDMTSALALEEECYEQLLYTKDRLEGLAAFAQKRKPKYIGE